MEMTVGPVPTEKCHKLCGLEVITRYTTDIPSRGLFFTDSNGREMQKRTLNQRPSWNLTVTEPVAGNYYPVNTAAALRGPAAELTVLVDRFTSSFFVSISRFPIFCSTSYQICRCCLPSFRTDGVHVAPPH